jgi:hypothetical protein
MTDLPQPVAQLVDVLAAMPGAVAVVLGGSHAIGTADAVSDWDLGLYYRGAIDLAPLAARGTVQSPGSWGRLMNGGAWLRCGGEKVDVILRDLDVVEHWTHRAQSGEFEVDHLLGYLAGVPTYLLTAELASCRVLRGELRAVPYPAKLAAAAPPWWRFCRSFSLDYGRMHARRGSLVGAFGQTAKGVVEEAHALLCERGEWACNEKKMIEAAGLAGVHGLFRDVPKDSAGLVKWVDLVAGQLGVPAGEVMPWNDAGRGAEPEAAPKGGPSTRSNDSGPVKGPPSVR